ncbi:Hcp family type VI secretion system effector [Archangium lansingense]|uniref:Type VI secretion system tube protein Hcp n=1 Tax=Archangium lansingense TaxID=2995310 RepID=A0ABT4AED3_9BACT|nr:type VI secretion system tube protein Hcp [Archangium lansinium]MCY1080025.1 type VI secretion system tube protein Hcp [Archangium lansinium]
MPANIYLKFEDAALKGESTSGQGKDEIEVIAFSHTVTKPLSSSQASNVNRVHGRTQHEDFIIKKWVDQTTPKLNQYCSQGVELKKATVTIYVQPAGKNNTSEQKGDAVKLFVYTMENVIISSVSVTGGVEDTAVETIALNYSAITWSNERNGSKTAGWDLAKNQPK